MSVDFDAIARAGRCDVSSLRLALPLIEQGYSPPFLARYRRDELSGIDESTLWALSNAFKSEQRFAARREELKSAWEQTTLRDPSITYAIEKASTPRVLNRIARLLKSESSDQVDDATRLAVRVLNPQKGDGTDFAEIAAKIPEIQDPVAAVAGLDQALATRLLNDPRIMKAATRWLARNAKIHVENISDPHGTEPEKVAKRRTSKANQGKSAASPPNDAPPLNAQDQSEAVQSEAKQGEAEQGEAKQGEAKQGEAKQSEADPIAAVPHAAAVASDAVGAGVTNPTPPLDSAPVTATATPADPIASPSSEVSAADSASPDQPTAPVGGGDPTSSDGKTAATRDSQASAEPDPSGMNPAQTANPAPVVDPAQIANPPQTANPAAAGTPEGKPAESAPKKPKKVSPRQRRRRWLVSVLKPLAGKRFKSDKLSAFQIVMLGRALRSQVANCAFEYDATRLVAEIQKTAVAINRPLEDKLNDLVLEHEANIREAAESAWWEDLAERASARLVNVAADHLRRHVNRGGVDAKVVLSIDAVGPRTAAAAIVTSDGRLVHSEDIPCQLSAAQRSQAVTKMGELIHHHHVDLIVISNGPARRASMIALGDLIKQSPEKSVRWTLADRSGADAYSGSAVADQEMRSTPRRFRAAAWLAYSVLQPAKAITKVDPLKLRLSSFQRELTDDAISAALEDVLISGASRGGVDVNSAPASWLARLPGMDSAIAEAIDQARRVTLFDSRETITDLDQWQSIVQSRQAIPFLRVFGSDESLDGTLVHPEDYALAKKLAKSLEIELPPNSPPGYVPPSFDSETPPVKSAELSEAVAKQEPAPVEDFSSAGEKSSDFALPDADPPTDAPVSVDTEVNENDLATEPTPEPAAEQAEASEPGAENPEVTTDAEAKDPADGESAPADAGQADAAPADAGQADAGQAQPATQHSDSEPQGHDRLKQAVPDRAKISKCVKEWQIGANRAQQIVNWLCEPFGDSDIAGTPPAVMSDMPTTRGLKPGDSVIGVVVSVMPFGVFVELAPDCSGLIHVSRISESFVEDLHEAVQVGDIVSAWVIGIDEKRRRVALSAISPERTRQLEEQQHAKGDRRSQHRGGHARGGQGGGTPGQRRGGDTGRSKPQGQAGQPASGDGRRGKDRPAGRSTGGRPAGGRAGGTPRGGRDRNQRGQGRGRTPESYRVESKEELKPITEEMQKGKEPMRTFGDLAQFFSKETSKEPVTEPPKSKSPQPKQPPPSADLPADSSADEVSTDSPAVDAQANDPPASEPESGESAAPDAPTS